MGIKTYLYLLAILGGSTAGLFSPIVALLTYMFVVFTASRFSWWYSGLAQMGVRTAMIPAVALLISMVMHRQRLELGRWKMSDIEKLLLVFLVLMWISPYIGYGKTEYSSHILQKMTKGYLIVFCMMRVVTYVEDYRLLRWMWIFSGFYLGYIALSAGNGMFTNGRLDAIGGGDFGGSSSLGHHLVMVLPFIGCTLMLDERLKYKAMAVVAGALTVNALIMARTRGAFLAILVGGLYALIRIPRQYRKKLIILAVVGLVGAVSLTDPGFWRRMGTIKVNEQEMEYSSAGRLELWQNSIHMLIDHPLGVGVGRFQDFIGAYIPEFAGFSPHNTFVRCYTDLGIQGLAIFLWIILAMLAKLRKIKVLTLENDLPRDYILRAFTLEVALIMGLAAGFFTERLYSEAIWWLVGMSVCLERSLVREQEMITKQEEEMLLPISGQ